VPAPAPAPLPAAPAPWPTTPARGAAGGTDAPAPPGRPPIRPEAGPGTPPAAAAEPPIVPREQLPEPVRAELAALKLGGSIYSARPSERSLIVNGQLCRENEVLAPGLTLEQIRPHSAVFRFKGYRFEQSL